MVFQLSAACGCNVGRRRRNNEDNFYFNGQILPPENHALKEILVQSAVLKQAEDFCVFDGMGGQADGQVAAGIAAEVFKQARESSPDRGRSGDDLKNIAGQMSDAVWQRAEREFSNMGTTAAMLRFTTEGFFACNVGDSRIYQMRRGVLRQISVDHTDEQFLRERGIQSKKPSLTQYIGVSPEELVIEPTLCSGALAAGDQYLLCSDGLTDMVSETQLAQLLMGQESPAEKVERLIQSALDGGGRDNVTVILIQVLPAPMQAKGAVPAEGLGTAGPTLKQPAPAPTERPVAVPAEGLGTAGPTLKQPAPAPAERPVAVPRETAAPRREWTGPARQTGDVPGSESGGWHQESAVGSDAVGSREQEAAPEYPYAEKYGRRQGSSVPLIAVAVVIALVVVGAFLFLFPLGGREEEADASAPASMISDNTYSIDNGKYYVIEESTRSGLKVVSTFDSKKKTRVSVAVYNEDGDEIVSTGQEDAKKTDQSADVSSAQDGTGADPEPGEQTVPAAQDAVESDGAVVQSREKNGTEAQE